ncbi:hypothetical protein, partial [Chitinophaga sp. sic0106]|uniref:hypothetical protein n=1 Tax=Chitinophaga sp. sic0106 TaxID=2854785 RepID=UPI001C449B61
TDVVTIYNYAANPAANAGVDQEDCGRTTAFTLDATPVVSTGNIQQIGTWTVQYTGANAAPTVSDIHDPKATIVVPVGDQVQLTWTVTSMVNGTIIATCPATTDVVTILNYAANPAANAGADQEDCGRTTAFTLDATPVVSTGNIQQIGTWTVQYTGANAAPTVSDIHDPKATITVTPGDQVQLTWTVTSIVNGVVNTNCPATTDVVTIYNYAANPAANAGADQEDCGRTTAFTLDATPVVSTGNIQQIGTWTVQYTGANAAPVVSDIHDPKATIVVPVGDQVQLTWTVTSIVNGVVNTNCPATTDVVTILNYAANPAANAGADQEDCGRTTAFTLDATPVVSTGNIQQIGTWTVQYTGANTAPVVSDIHDPKAIIVVPVGDQVQLTWTVTSIVNGVVNTNCPATTDVVTIYNYAANPAANAGADQEDCGRTTAFTLDATPVVSTGNIQQIGTWTVQYTGANTAPVVSDIHDPKATITVTPGDQVQLTWTVTSIVNGVVNTNCPATTDVVTIYNYAANPAANAGADQEDCGRTTAFTLDATPVVSTGNIQQIGTWTVQYTGANTAPVVSDIHDPKATITVTPGDQVQLTWTVTSIVNGVVNTNCPATTDVVTIYNYAANPAANAGADQEDCGRTTAFTLDATPVVSTGNIQQIGTWTVQYTGANTAPTVSDIHDPKATITVTPGDQVQLTWTITSIANGVVNTNCPATTDVVTIYNYAANPAANAGVDQEDCGRTTAFTLDATPVVSTGNIQQIGTWTVQYTGANAAPVVSDIHDPKATIVVPVGDQVQLTWTVTSIVNGVVNTNCPATTDVVTIYNYAANPAANAGADQEDCGRTTAFTLDATPVVSTGNIQQIGTWTVQYTGANAAPVVSDIHDPKATIVVPVGDQVQLTWTVTSMVNGVVNTNCPATTDVVTIYNYAANPAANAGADQEDCGRTTAFTLDATPVVSTGNIQQIGTWTVQYTGANTAPTVSDIHDPKATIIVPVGDQVQLTWTVTSIVNGVVNTNCPATTDVVTIYNYAANPAANAGADQEDCGRTTAFTLDATPVISTGNIQQIGTWTVQYTGANTAPTVSDIHDPKATITVTPGDQVQLTWTITSIVNGTIIATCPATTDVVTILNYAANPAANAGADQEDCGRTTAFTLDATPVVSTGNIQQIGTWTVQYTGANTAPTVSDIHDPKATIIVPVGDQVQLTWTVTSIVNGVVNTNCPATTDVVTIYNYAANPAANAGVDQEDCGRTTAFTLDATPVVSTGNIQQIGTWTVQYTGANAAPTVSDIHDPKATIVVPVGDQVQLTWTVTSMVNGTIIATCPATTDVVTIYNYAANPAANAGADQEDCGRTTAFTLDATPVVSTGNIQQIGTWTVQYTGANAAPVVSDIHDPKATITVTPGDQVQLTWTITSMVNGTIIATCPATTDVVTIYNYAANPAANAGADQEDCGRTTAFTLDATPVVSTGNIQQIGTWTVQYTGANTAPVVSDIHDPKATITVTPGDQVQLTWTVTSMINGTIIATCPATTNVVTIYNYAANPAANAGADQEDCGRTTAFTLDATPVLSTGNIQQIGTWTVQYTGANAAPVVSDIHDPKATITVTPGDQVQLTWTVTSMANGVVNTNCPATTDVVTIYNYAANPAANAGADQEDCGRTTAFTLDATPVVSTGNIQQIGTWTVQYAGANAAPVVSDIHDPKATITVTPGDQVQLTWTVTSMVNGAIITTCPATTDVVTIYNYAANPAANAGADQEDCGRTTAFTLDATPVVSTGNIQQIGTWTVQYTGANTAPTVSDIHDPKATITVTPGDQVQLTWTVTSMVNGTIITTCPATTDVVTIYNYAANPAANAGADQEDCGRTTAFTLDATPVVSTGNIQQIGTWTVQYTGANAAPVVSDIHDPKATITVTPGDQVQLTWT